MEERLQKILSRAGIASRRAAERVLAEGRITVNGETVTEVGTKADLERDDVRVDGVRVRPAQAPVYLVLNKPKGVVTTRRDPEGRPTVMELVPTVAGLFPVGRLDVGTEGVLILTNDGAFAERVSHPRYEVPRVYLAKVRSVPEPETIERLRRGVTVDGERLAADRVRLVESDRNAWVEVTLHEGKNHEVRRLLEAVGHPVSKLRRVSIGPVTVRGLEPGEFRALTPQEVHALLKPGARGHERPRGVARPRRPSNARRSRQAAPHAGSARHASPGRPGSREGRVRRGRP
ncbi:MAG TPA: pseudouridine synthase [Vicinamibacteria bacterium]|nr:pseudouridine synthase [Vicinamibacteria bacterium]